METVTRNWSDLSHKVLGAVVGAIAAGTATVSGLDSVILWLWNGVFGLAGTGAEMPATVAAVVGTIIGAFIGGYLPKEKLSATATTTPSSGSVLRSPPIATGLAFGLTLLFLVGALAGCASSAGGVREDISGHIATAERYVGVAVVAADACVAAQVPFCVEHAGDIAKAKAVAAEALEEAKAIAASDPTEAQTLLRVAMNSVLLFYSLR